MTSAERIALLDCYRQKRRRLDLDPSRGIAVAIGGSLALAAFVAGVLCIRAWMVGV